MPSMNRRKTRNLHRKERRHCKTYGAQIIYCNLNASDQEKFGCSSDMISLPTPPNMNISDMVGRTSGCIILGHWVAMKLAITSKNTSDLDEYGCLQSLNDGAKDFNEKLHLMCDELRVELKNATIIYFDMFAIRYDLIANATKYDLLVISIMVYCLKQDHDVAVMTWQELDALAPNFTSGVNFAVTGAATLATMLKHHRELFSDGDGFHSALYNFWVHNTGPLGCLPQKHITATNGNASDYDQYGCLKQLNDRAKAFNEKRSALCDELKSEIGNVTTVSVDIYCIKYDLIAQLFSADLLELQSQCGTRILDIYVAQRGIQGYQVLVVEQTETPEQLELHHKQGSKDK
ncbi:GDSL lipase/esterase, partial [Dillenia turbinata]